MKILITGAYGFIGKNLICELENKGYNDLCFCGRGTEQSDLEKHIAECDFIFHLAGVNRPRKEEEFMEGNGVFTEKLVGILKKCGKKTPIVYASSTQAALDNPYGRSKLAAEKVLREYGEDSGAAVFIYRLTNVFGKWCRPDYNSVVATFCNNIAQGIPIQVNDANRVMELVYIDDVIRGFIVSLEEECLAQLPTYSVKLGELAQIISGFRESRTTLQIPDMSNELIKKLYSTYLSYLPKKNFSYLLKMNTDERGSFTEILKSASFGQVSVNISKPGIVKGNHWHHSKNEKFLVVSGHGIIRFRKVAELLENQDQEQIIEYEVSGEKLEVIDIPPGYTHNIENLGQSDMVTLMWANESFDPHKPDTYFLEV